MNTTADDDETRDDETQAVVIERMLDAPVALVWQMWTDSEHFAAWYGPDGATVPHADMDVRVGGRRSIHMTVDTPDGRMEMRFGGEYREVVDDQRLVYTEFIADADGNPVPPSAMGMPGDHPTVTEVTVELEPLGDRTRMVMTHAGVPADSPGAAGWTMALDKLATHLAASAG